MFYLLDLRFVNGDHVLSILGIGIVGIWFIRKRKLSIAISAVCSIIGFHETLFMIGIWLFYKTIFYYPPLDYAPWPLIWALVFVGAYYLRPIPIKLILVWAIPFLLWWLIGFPQSRGYITSVDYRNTWEVNLLEISVVIYYCVTYMVFADTKMSVKQFIHGHLVK